MRWLVTDWMGRLIQMDWMGHWWGGGGMDQNYQAPEQERNHWLLRSGRLWEVMAGTDFFGAAKARNICVRVAE